MKGKLVLIPFPFTDLTSYKLRPALVIHEGDKDVIVAFISSRLPSTLSDYDVVIRRDHPEFKSTGLKIDSIIRLEKTATIIKELIVGEIGEIGPILREEINRKLDRLFRL